MGTIAWIGARTVLRAYLTVRLYQAVIDDGCWIGRKLSAWWGKPHTEDDDVKVEVI